MGDGFKVRTMKSLCLPVVVSLAYFVGATLALRQDELKHVDVNAKNLALLNENIGGYQFPDGDPCSRVYYSNNETVVGLNSSKNRRRKRFSSMAHAPFVVSMVGALSEHNRARLERVQVERLNLRLANLVLQLGESPNLELSREDADRLRIIALRLQEFHQKMEATNRSHEHQIAEFNRKLDDYDKAPNSAQIANLTGSDDDKRHFMSKLGRQNVTTLIQGVAEIRKMVADYQKGLVIRASQLEKLFLDSIKEIDSLSGLTARVHQAVANVWRNRAIDLERIDAMDELNVDLANLTSQIDVIGAKPEEGAIEEQQKVGSIAQSIRQFYEAVQKHVGQRQRQIDDIIQGLERHNAIATFGQILNRLEFLRSQFAKYVRFCPLTNELIIDDGAELWAEAVLLGKPNSVTIGELLKQLDNLIRGGGGSGSNNVGPDGSGVSSPLGVVPLAEIYADTIVGDDFEHSIKSQDRWQSRRFFVEAVVDELLMQQRFGYMMQMLAMQISSDVMASQHSQPQLVITSNSNSKVEDLHGVCETMFRTIVEQETVMEPSIQKVSPLFRIDDSMAALDATIDLLTTRAEDIGRFVSQTEVVHPTKLDPASSDELPATKRLYPITGCRFCFECATYMPRRKIVLQCRQNFVMSSPSVVDSDDEVDADDGVGASFHHHQLRAIDLLSANNEIEAPNSAKVMASARKGWLAINKANLSAPALLVLTGMLRVDDPLHQVICGVETKTMAPMMTPTAQPKQQQQQQVLALRVDVCKKTSNAFVESKEATLLGETTKVKTATTTMTPVRGQAQEPSRQQQTTFEVVGANKISIEWVQPNPLTWITGIGLAVREPSKVLEFIVETEYF